MIENPEIRAFSMFAKLLLVLALLAGWPVSLSLAGPKSAKVEKECPTSSSLDSSEEAIRKAPTCKQALEIMEACALGASGDTALGEAVVEKCEAGFLSKLSKAQRRDYDRGIKQCDNKYRRESGSMYRSFEAFCRAQLAVRTEAKFSKLPPRK